MSRMGDTGASNQGQGFTEQAKQTGQQVGQNLRDLGGQVRDQAQQKYNEMSDQAREYYEQGRQKAQEWEQGLESYIQEKPLQAVLIAAGVGVLLGLLWKRS
ncbi:MAG TPA: hypothetical protein VGI81_21450 [Tepidisphaeraceae bacterium]